MNCGPVCIQYVLKKHGYNATLEEVVAECQTNRLGTTYANMAKALTDYKFYVTEYRLLTWEWIQSFLDWERDVFISWWSPLDDGAGNPGPPDGHWCVVESLTPESVFLFDPDPETIIEVPKALVWANWYDYEIDAGGNRINYIRSALTAEL